MSDTATNKKRFLLVMLAFILPVVLAKLALEADFFNRGATNKGELLAQPLDFSSVSPKDHKWRMIYLLPGNCDQSCENAVYSLNQVYIALGKNMDRAESMLLVPEGTEAPADWQKQYPKLNLLTVSEQSVKRVFKDVSTDGIFIVDTLDNIILRYPLQQQKQQAVMHSRDILADMRKLLKLSRIG